MKNTFGNAVTVTLFGESHGPAIGAVLDGLPGGIRIDEEYIAARLTQRRPSGRISTARREPDRYEILSGVFNGYTTGTPLCIIIRNEDTRSEDYDSVSRLARPSHADLTAMYRYGGFEDYRGGGHFSGRITAALVAAGAVVMKALEDKGILIGTHIKRCAGVDDREISSEADFLFTGSHFDLYAISKSRIIITAAHAAAEAAENLPVFVFSAAGLF